MKKHENLPEVDPVELKQILSMRPGLFILISAIVVVLLILFSLFLLPGIISDTCYVTFNSDVANVAVYDGEKYLGSTEGSVYKIESGKHDLSFKVDGVDAGRIEYNAQKHYFFTLFSRHVDTVDIEIENTKEIEEKVISTFAKSIASWSEVLDYSDSYHFPPLYTNFAQNAVALGFSDIEDVWLYGAMHVSSETLYNNYKEGLSILNSSSVKYNSDELESLNNILDALYQRESSRKIAKNGTNGEIKTKKTGSFFSYDENTIIIGDDCTLSYPDVNRAPVSVTTDSFSIAATPVTEYEYALFVEENPDWAKSNKDSLIEEGLVDEYYLEGITLSTAIKAQKPIRNISWYAAKAYCEWKSEKDGVSYKLPSESEWTVAALSAKDKSYTSSLIAIDKDDSSPSFMLGQLWEFTDTNYIPLARMNYEKAMELSSSFDYDDVIIKGGSYINDSSSIDENTVGVVEKSTCSEYIGFRVAKHE